MEPVQIVLVGCGAVSRLFYLPTLRTLAARGELNVHALVDRNAEAAAPLLQAFPAAVFAQNFDGIPPPQGPTLCIIASPPGLHKAHTLAAAARGWHVLCEKPIAAHSDECPAMIEACAQAGVSLSIGHYKRFFPASQQLKALCAGQSPLGELLSYEIHEGGPFNWPAASASFFDKKATPGGVLLDIGIHVFDLLLWWLGTPLELTHEDDAMGGLETNTCTRLWHQRAKGCVRLSRDWATKQRYHFQFQHGSATWSVNDANGLTIQLEGLPHPLQSQLLTPDSKQPADTNPQSFIRQLQHCLSVTRGEAQPLVTGQEATQALALVERCYRERSLLQQPWLSTEEHTRARHLAEAAK